ncbi:MAG TPA: DUF3710 domain-containing protein [Mycobacteriales bacterium]|nr:DUF3710 domain-containing protein [Mycobacteriales bacterium]
MFRRRRATDDELDEQPEAAAPGESGDGFDDVEFTRDDEAWDGSDSDDVRPALPDPDAAETWNHPGGRRDLDTYAVTAGGRPKGPWDSHDVPKDDETPRIDLGGIRVPLPDGMEIRVDVQDEVPIAATLVDGPSALQVHGFAAPKSSGLWAEVRAEIAESLRGSGGSAQEAEGAFGTELRARIPTDGGLQPARFIGVDGPRWFLRGLLTGPAGSDPARAKRLEAAFRDVVVHRGGDAMAPRDMLPMHLPREAHEHAAPPDPEDRSIPMPERGPEITETR